MPFIPIPSLDLPMQMQDKQPINFNTVLGLQKNIHRDADVGKLMTEVDTKMKSFTKTTFAHLENYSVRIKSIVKKTSCFIKKALVLEISISKIRKIILAAEPSALHVGSLEMWDSTTFLSLLIRVFDVLVCRQNKQIVLFFDSFAVDLVGILSPLDLVAGDGDRSIFSKYCGDENFVNLAILKSLERTLRSLGSAGTLNTDNFEVVFIHVFHDIVQMVQELIEVIAPFGLGVGSLSCIKNHMDCGKDRGLIGFTNYGLLKTSENGTRLLGPTATQINDDGFVLGINNLDKNCLGNNVAVEAGNGNLVEDCMNENYPSNAKNGSRKDGWKEDDILNDCSRLKGKF